MTDEAQQIEEAMAILNQVVFWVNEWRDLGGFLSATVSQEGDWSNVCIEAPRLTNDDNMGRMRTRVLLEMQPDWPRLSFAIRALGGAMLGTDGEAVH